MSFQPRRVLVTGGAGFIGAHLLRRLLADPARTVITLDALTYAGSRTRLQGLPADRHVFVHGDITDAALVRHLLREHGIDTIVNLAAESHVDRSIAGPEAFVRTNVQGTFTLLEAARQVWCEEQGLAGAALQAARRFHQVSTDEVYGSLAADAPPFAEHSPYAPRSPYAASKAAADHLVRAWGNTWQLPVLITACSNNYGPGQHAEKFIPVIIRHALAQQPIPVYGDGAQRREWLHVDDHCRALECVLRGAHPGATYNIGSGHECSNLELVQLICALLDRRRPAGAPHARLVHHVADRPGHDRRYALDARRLRAELGWRPQVEFLRGLTDTVDWYLACNAGI